MIIHFAAYYSATDVHRQISISPIDSTELIHDELLFAAVTPTIRVMLH